MLWQNSFIVSIKCFQDSAHRISRVSSIFFEKRPSLIEVWRIQQAVDILTLRYITRFTLTYRP